MTGKLIYLDDYRKRHKTHLNWWHLFTVILFFLSFAFLIYVMTFLVMEVGTILGFLWYLIRL